MELNLQIFFQDLDNLLEELLAWLNDIENKLVASESEELPDDKYALEIIISDHREFMENMTSRQSDVDRVCKSRVTRPLKDTKPRGSKQKLCMPR